MTKRQKSVQVSKELEDLMKELKKRRAKFAFSPKAGGQISFGGKEEPVHGNVSACDITACDPPEPTPDPPPVLGNLAGCDVNACGKDS